MQIGRVISAFQPSGANTFLYFDWSTADTFTINCYKDGAQQWQLTGAADSRTNIWVMLALVHDGTPKFYVDGNRWNVTTNNSFNLAATYKTIFHDASNKANSLTLGATRLGSTTFHPFDGWIAQARIYDIAITDFSWYMTNTHPTNELETTFGP